MLSITVGGVRITGSGKRKGLFVAEDGFKGWDDGVDVRDSSPDRPLSDGSFDLPVNHGTRVVSISGHALARTEAELGHLRHTIMGVCATGRVRMSVEHHGAVLWADVRRAAKPVFTDSGLRNGVCWATFDLFLKAADPRKFGASRTFASGVPAFHYGNFPASPTLLVTGSFPNGYTVTSGTAQIVVSSALSAGSTDRIDVASGRVFRNGSRLTGDPVRTQSFTIGPGRVRPISVAGAGGSGQVVTIVADTYI